MAYAPIEYSDQPAHPRSLIRVFDVRSMGSPGFNVSSGGKQRLWSNRADAQTGLNLSYTRLLACALSWIPARYFSLSHKANARSAIIMATFLIVD